MRVTHGRHCLCSSCKREDWTKITVPCGMHGRDCPAVYAPLDPLGDVLAVVKDEVRTAMRRFPDFNSPHEGWAVIREELDELWEHVRANTGRSDGAAKEAVQVAAMALRYVLDCHSGTTTPALQRESPDPSRAGKVGAG